MKLAKLIIVAATIAIVGVLAFFLLTPKAASPQPESIASFDECVASGYPVQESYPARCMIADGKSFAQDIGNELEKKDLITIQNPRPNTTTTNPIEIRGAARGTWFFEASFPIKLVDDEGNIIAQTAAEAQDEWMTEEFVPYKADLEFETDAERGTLILEKNNPSGLPENADRLEIPVKF